MDTHSVSNLSFSRLEINVIAIVICASLQECNHNFILASYVVWKGSHEQDGNEIAYAWEPGSICLYTTLEGLWNYKFYGFQFYMVQSPDEFQGSSQFHGHRLQP